MIPPPLSGPLVSKDVPYLWNGSLVPAQHGDYEIYYEVVDTPTTQWSTDIKGCPLPGNGCLVPAQHGDYEIYYEIIDTPSTKRSTDIKGCSLPVEWQSCASPA